MRISSDSIELFDIGPFTVNATMVFILVVMAVLFVIAWLGTRKISHGMKIGRWQTSLEMTVTYMKSQIREVTQQDPEPFMPFIGSLFLFIVVSNLLAIVPGYQPPTGSLSVTAALAICVFFAVPIFGVSRRGVRAYFSQYIQPSPLMLPFNIIGELSRTLALAVRLFGNIMSGSIIAAVLISVIPLVLPVVMQLLGVIVGVIQAYIFAILATVYIASATKVQVQKEQKTASPQKENNNTGD